MLTGLIHNMTNDTFSVSMNPVEYEEELVYRKMAQIKSKIEEAKDSDDLIVEQLGPLLEMILMDCWWEIAGRISRSKTMFGTGYKVRYELVKNNIDVRTVKGKGK